MKALRILLCFPESNRIKSNDLAIPGPYSDGAVTLYMYAVGSPFESIITDYMIDSRPIHPPTSSSQLLNGTLIRLAANQSLDLSSML